MSQASRFLALVATTTVMTSTATAQAVPPAAPDIRILTISTFRVPLGEDRQKVVDYMQKWMVEPARLNPNVLSYRIIQHFYGSNSSDMAIVAEYPNWAAITADCAPCDKWFETNMPKEGTPERKAVDEAQALFLKYYGTHADQIYNANMALAKP